MSHTEGVRELTALLNLLNDPRSAILLGARASFSSGVPLADESVKRIARRVFAECVLGGKVMPE